MRCHWIRFLALSLFACAARPSNAADLDNLLNGYSLTSWNDGDGRPLGSVYAISQDNDGYLWIGTDAGLFRFDGSRFTAWEVMSETPLPASAVTALSVSSDGSLWAGLADGAGVHRIHDGQVQARTEGLDPVGSVTDLVQDRDATMWAVSDAALYHLVDGHWVKVSLPWPRREGRVLRLFVRRNGELWVGTRWGVFRKAEHSDSFQVMSEEYVWGVSEDADNVVWTTDIAAGFRRLGARTAPRHPLEGAGYRLMHDRKRNLWVATFGEGLWRVRDAEKVEGSTVERAALRTGLSSDSVQSLTEDRDGNIWVGTTGGLHRLTQRKLTPVENVGFVVAVEPAEDARVWAGTTNGVVRFSTRSARWERARTGSPAPDVRALYRDPKGTLWVGATDGLWHFENGGLVRVPLAVPASTQILSISPDGRGGLWLGDGDWLFRRDGTRLIPFGTRGGGSGTERITFAHADRSGRLWVGFAGGDLGLAEAGGTVRKFGPDEGFTREKHQTIYAVFEDDEGGIWIGSSGGLSRFANGRFTTVNRDNGLPGNRVWAIVEDLRGHLWLSVDRGIVRLDRSEVAKAAADASHRMQYRLFDTLDGVAGAAIGIIGAVRASDGTLLFVRGGGLTLAHPDDVDDDHGQEAAPLRIEAGVANERRFSPSVGTSFPPGTRRLQISYTALTLTASNKIRFRYRLEGFDTDWVDAGARRAAFYTNLSPRNYRFLVEASTEDGPWNTSTAAWDFSIRPAFYQTNLFYASSVAAVVLAVWAAWRFRLGLVRRQFSLVLAERARLSREIHDTLLQSLVGVALQFDAISNNLGPSSSAARDQLDRIRRHVEAYIREARQSIWDLRSPLLETRDLATALREFGKNAVAEKPVRFVATTIGTPRQCSPKIENQLLRIGQEAMTNAVRHADARRIQLELRFDDRSVTLRVSDDGRGFDGECWTIETDSHYGLTTMKERAEQLGGQFSIETAIGRGTSVKTVVPMSMGAEGTA